MSWIQTAYLIAEVIAIPLTGVLTRVLTMRWLFVVAVSLFTLASVGCAASASFAALIAWRVVQGFAGGTLIPAVFAAVFLLFPARQQGLATTLAGVLAVLAPTVGPVVGGWITADLFLALAVPDQRRARDDRPRSVPGCLLPRQRRRPRPPARARRRRPCAPRCRALRPGDRAEAGAAERLGLGRGPRPAVAQRRRPRSALSDRTLA